MRSYKVQVNGRTYAASSELLGEDRFRVALDGEVFEGESLSEGAISTWIVRSGDETVRAECRVLQNGRVDVWVAGLPFRVLSKLQQLLALLDYWNEREERSSVVRFGL